MYLCDLLTIIISAVMSSVGGVAIIFMRLRVKELKRLRLNTYTLYTRPKSLKMFKSNVETSVSDIFHFLEKDLTLLLVYIKELQNYVLNSM
jgi:hypothetical protein